MAPLFQPPSELTISLVKPALGTRRDRGTSWRFAMTCHPTEPRPGVWHERAALMVRTELVVDGETIQYSAEGVHSIQAARKLRVDHTPDGMLRLNSKETGR